MKKTALLLCFVVLGFSGLKAQQLHTKQAPLPCLDKQFSIVAHIVLDSLGQTNIEEEDILAGIDTLNQYFAPLCVSFEVCAFRIIPNFQYNALEGLNEWEELQVVYHQKNRINLFFVEEIAFAPLECGYTDNGSIAVLDQDGIAVLKACVTEQPKSITHEMGHYFGLLNTYEGSSEPADMELVDGSNCDTAGDGLCDTPADPFVLEDLFTTWVDVSLGCRFVYAVPDPNGQQYIPDVGNLMSGFPDACKCGFTYEQYVRMAQTYLSADEAMW